MAHSGFNILKATVRKLAVLVLIASSGFAAYATLGDGKSGRSDAPKKSLLTNRPVMKPGVFSLRSGYTFRGNSVINNNAEKRYININTVVTMQKGNTTYILPLKKKILENVKVEIGNRQFQHN